MRQNQLPNSVKKEYKLFEANDIATYGLSYAIGNTLSPLAYKGMMYLIWKAVMQNALTEDADKPFSVELSITEFGEALGFSKDDINRNFARDIRHVCELLTEITSQKIRVHDAEHKEYAVFVLLTYVDVQYDKNRIYVEFSRQISQYFGLNLKKDFTVIKLKYLNRLNRGSSVILYPFFCRYSNMGCITWETDRLSKLLTNNEHYEYKYLKRDYINPAVEEINDKTDMEVRYEEIKEGRSVVKIKFFISDGPAKDEIEKYMEYNDETPGEYIEMDYDNEWMKEYDYCMATQTYKKRKNNYQQNR